MFPLPGKMSISLRVSYRSNAEWRKGREKKRGQIINFLPEIVDQRFYSIEQALRKILAYDVFPMPTAQALSPLNRPFPLNYRSTVSTLFMMHMFCSQLHA